MGVACERERWREKSEVDRSEKTAEGMEEEQEQSKERGRAKERERESYSMRSLPLSRSTRCTSHSGDGSRSLRVSISTRSPLRNVAWIDCSRPLTLATWQ
eukprot:439904-Pleurochrysis_carterae.AAC.1